MTAALREAAEDGWRAYRRAAPHTGGRRDARVRASLCAMVAAEVARLRAGLRADYAAVRAGGPGYVPTPLCRAYDAGYYAAAAEYLRALIYGCEADARRARAAARTAEAGAAGEAVVGS